MAELVATIEKMTDDACAAGAVEDMRLAGQIAVAAVKQAHYDAVAKIEKARLDAIAQKQVRHLCSATMLWLCCAFRTPWTNRQCAFGILGGRSRFAKPSADYGRSRDKGSRLCRLR
jgi:hypothetical protein